MVYTAIIYSIFQRVFTLKQNCSKCRCVEKEIQLKYGWFGIVLTAYKRTNTFAIKVRYNFEV